MASLSLPSSTLSAAIKSRSSASDFGQARAEQARAQSANGAAAAQVQTSKTPNQKSTDQKIDWAKMQTESRLEVNQGLVQAMFSKPDQRDTKAMQIFYQEIVTELEAVLREQLDDPEFSFEKLAAKTLGIEGQEDYWSPTKTAERIVAGATGFFSTFQEQNPHLSQEEQVDRFLNIISPAVDKGIGQAIEILEGFSVFDGSIKENTLSTQEQVHHQLAAWRERMLPTQEEIQRPPTT